MLQPRGCVLSPMGGVSQPCLAGQQPRFGLPARSRAGTGVPRRWVRTKVFPLPACDKCIRAAHDLLGRTGLRRDLYALCPGTLLIPCRLSKQRCRPIPSCLLAPAVAGRDHGREITGGATIIFTELV